MWFNIVMIILIAALLGLLMAQRQQAKKSVQLLNESDFLANMRKGQLVDLRKAAEFEEGHINGAKNIPAALMSRSVNRFRKDQPIYLYDTKGKSVRNVAMLLKGKGHEQIFALEGGIEGFSGTLRQKRQK